MKRKLSGRNPPRKVPNNQPPSPDHEQQEIDRANLVVNGNPKRDFFWKRQSLCFNISAAVALMLGSHWTELFDFPTTRLESWFDMLQRLMPMMWTAWRNQG